jgi:hypothetical protein
VSDKSEDWGFSRARLRRSRSLVPLAGLLSVVLVASFLIGLFGLHYTHQGHATALERATRYLAGVDHARQGQVHFKEQVQEWKNVLLRGDDPALYDRYFQAFETQETQVRSHLRSLRELAPRIGVDAGRVGALLAAHEELGRAYRDALARDPGETVIDAKAVDRSVRGIDRALNRDMDALAESIRGRVDTLQTQLSRNAEGRYRSVRQASMAGLTVSLLLILAFLVLAIRGDRAR